MNIIITGASEGIGYQTAMRFAAEKENHVLAVARSVDKLEQLKAEVQSASLSGKVSILAYDIRSKKEIGLTKYCSDIGMDRIDVLINNAGLLINKPFEELTWEDWQAIYETNVIGLARLTAVLLPIMGGDKASHIINISSMGGIPHTSKFAGLSAYSSSKGAISILSECMAEEFKGKNISVNALALGAVQTEMLKAAFPEYEAPVTPQEFASYLYWFATEGNRFINGKVIPVGLASV